MSNEFALLAPLISGIVGGFSGLLLYLLLTLKFAATSESESE